MKQTICGIEFDVEVRWDEGTKAWCQRIIPADMPCPRCRSIALVTIHYTFFKDVVMFRCPKCGLFEHTEGVGPGQHKATDE